MIWRIFGWYLTCFTRLSILTLQARSVCYEKRLISLYRHLFRQTSSIHQNTFGSNSPFDPPSFVRWVMANESYSIPMMPTLKITKEAKKVK